VVHLAAKKRARVIQKSRSCSLFVFFIFQEWSMTNLFHRVTVNAAFYVEVLNRLRECVQRVRPELWAEKNWIPASQQCTLAFGTYCASVFRQKDMITTDHPSYLPDLAPCNFFLFSKVKTIMRGGYFGDVNSIKCETTRLLKNLTSQDMQHCFLQWKQRWAKCIHSGEEYF
jgi:hypothetical protein